ncbi:META domain-containing protein [Hymenobacter pini]|uniref:META domain-containing protein n=1 Tax=Hymenobacter pini TaxID=2880879 RepID=UPI001CF3C95D|nr:META domain-containing protein [Hymenobacter pini]MCA8829518.1 META domain-containing protein [Hymenobacter pini]
MRLVLLSLSTLLLAAGCQEDAQPAQQLQQTRWMLSQVEDFPINLSSYTDSYRTYVQFSPDNTTTGLSPCNSFSGTYSLHTSNGKLAISQQTATQTSCAVQALENRYLNALPRTVRYELVGKELRLYEDGLAKPHLIFTAAQ